MTDLKQLKKIAAACRAAGIKHYRCAEFEFTLSDTTPESNYKKRQAKVQQELSNPMDQNFSAETLPEEALMFWSAADITGPQNLGAPNEN